MNIDFVSCNPGVNGEYPQNLFLNHQYKGRPALVGTPGLSVFCDIGSEVEIRGMIQVGGLLYAVCGNTFYKITRAGVATSKGTLNSSTGKAFMEYNGTQIMILANKTGYIYTLSSGAFAEITDSDFPSATSLTFQDGYFLVSKENTDEIYISDLNDGSSWSGDYASAEGDAGDVVAVYSDHRELLIFGESSIEVWYNSGADYPFDRRNDVYIEDGLGATASVASKDNRIFWLNIDGIVKTLENYTPTVISERSIEEQISDFGNFSDAIGYTVSFYSIPFYVLTLPKQNKTYLCNLTDKSWSTWASYPTPYNGRHRSNCCATLGNYQLLGDYENGIIYKLDKSVYTDNGETIKASRTSPPIISQDQKRVFHKRLEIEIESGVGLTGGVNPGEDPQITLSWSDNLGKTWSNEYWRSMGKIGEYDKRCVWSGMGSAINRSYKTEITDPVLKVIYSVSLDARIGRY